MTAQQRSFFPQGVNMYVPAMAYVHDVVHRGVFECSLGSPTGYDEDGIHDNFDGDGAADLTLYAADFVGGAGAVGFETDAVYGQTLVMKVSADPGAGGIDVDVTGEDYLGQPMKERLTTANGATAAVEGAKAFKRVLKVVLQNPATNAITFDLGWGTRLGLPYKMAKFAYAKENGVIVNALAQHVVGDKVSVDVSGANTAATVAPITGYLIGSGYTITTAHTTAAAVLAASVNGVAKANFDLTVPVAAAGFSGENLVTKANWVPVTKGDAVTFLSDGGGDAGVVDVWGIFSQGTIDDVVMPDTTDPATLTTDDPRGLYDPATAPDGTKEYSVAYYADTSVNASGNGGLHGIRHFIS